MRVYVAWQGVMPSPGVINASYLDQVEQLVALLAAHNISSILDCHQDVLAPAFCGEGTVAAAAAAAATAAAFHSYSLTTCQECPSSSATPCTTTAAGIRSRFPSPFPPPTTPTPWTPPLDTPTVRAPCLVALLPFLTCAAGTECLQAPFWHYYFSDAVSKGFQSLYDNDGGVLDAFEQFWITVATRFKDNPAVRYLLNLHCTRVT